jgi:hypothetical protein
LPGDDLIPVANLSATRAISVGRRRDVVWPWIAQLGQGRGGFYSYDFLENLVGCNIKSAEQIVPEWQHVVVGDEVRLAPDVPLKVALVEPGRTLVLRGRSSDRGHAPALRLHVGIHPSRRTGRLGTLTRPRALQLPALVGTTGGRSG